MIISILEKTPDVLIGAFAAGAVWFGFNYVVLADRAMANLVQRDIIPSCTSRLQAMEDAQPVNRIPQVRMPAPRSDNPFEVLIGKAIELATEGQRLSHYERKARCVCAAETTARSVKFDYAVHTSSFRLIETENLGSLRAKSMNLVKSETCGALPWMNIGG